MPYYISPPPQNPLSRIIAAIVAVFVLIVTFMLGLAAFLVIGGVVLVGAIVIWIRVAWIKRRLRKDGVDLGVPKDASTGSGQVIDAEYTVVETREEPGEK